MLALLASTPNAVTIPLEEETSFPGRYALLRQDGSTIELTRERARSGVVDDGTVTYPPGYERAVRRFLSSSLD